MLAVERLAMIVSLSSCLIFFQLSFVRLAVGLAGASRTHNLLSGLQTYHLLCTVLAAFKKRLSIITWLHDSYIGMLQAHDFGSFNETKCDSAWASESRARLSRVSPAQVSGRLLHRSAFFSILSFSGVVVRRWQQPPRTTALLSV